MSLEPLHILNLLYQYFLIIKDHQQILKEPTVLDISADEDSEKSDPYSAQSQESQRTLYYPDLYVLTNDEHWTMTPETHEHAAAAGSFCFVTTENGDKQDICNLITMPCVQRSLYFKNFDQQLRQHES